MSIRTRPLLDIMVLALCVAAASPTAARAQTLDERCVATVLNRMTQVNPDGTFAVGNVPIPVAGGAFRVRIVCETPEGVVRAQTAFIQGIANGDTPVGEITFGGDLAPIPVTLEIASPATTLTEATPGAQLVTTGVLVDGTRVDLTPAATGMVYLSSNPAIATVSADGFVTALSSGAVMITAAIEGVIATIQIDVVLSDDGDGDEMPDDFEEANAVSPGGTNLARGPTVAVSASSTNGAIPARAVDGDVRTSWFSADGDAVNQGGTPFIEVMLAQDATLAQVRVLGNRESRDGFDVLTGAVTAFDAADAPIFDSGVLALPGPNRDLAVALGVAGIRRVRFTPASDEGARVGVSELQLIGGAGAAGLDPDDAGDAAEDFDFDGLTNRDEFELGTNLFSDDTDLDGLDDFVEEAIGSNPLLSDTDADGLVDGDERDPTGDTDTDGAPNVLDPDSDADGLPDGVEVAIGLDPLDPDTDNDALPDGNEDTDGDGIVNTEELIENTDPGDPDTDGDGISDGRELVDGTDPLTPEGIAPVVTLLRPAPGSQVIEGRRIEIRFTATDNVAVSVVRLRENGVLVEVDETPTFFRAVRTVPLDVASVDYEITAFDTNGNSTVLAFGLDVVEDVGTTVAGRVLDEAMAPVEGATARLRRDPTTSATTDANGDFLIPGVSNLLGPVAVIARGLVGGRSVQGGTALTDQVVGGTTDVGDIVLRPQPPYPGEIFAAGDDGEGMHAAASGDFNGDEIPDLAAANRGRFGQDPTDGHVSIFIGVGDGTFEPEVRLAAGVRPQAVAVADFNEDDALDLAVANQGSAATVHLGNGDGTFQAAVEVGTGALGDQFFWVAVGDVNGDDDRDFVVVGDASTYHLQLGNGDGTFQPEVLVPASGGNLMALLRDMDGDGFDDVVTARNAGFSGFVIVSSGNGDGTFAVTAVLPLGNQVVARGADVADLNKDEIPDILALGNDGEVMVFLGTGNRAYAAPLSYPISTGRGFPTLVDLNGDGELDLVAPAGSDSFTQLRMSVLLGRTGGDFGPETVFGSPSRGLKFVPADFNGDGAVDLAMANLEPFNIEDADVSVLLGEGDGTFFARRVTPFVTNFFFVMTEFFAVGDFDEDGNSDLVIPISGTFEGDGLRFLAGNGDGTFASSFTLIATSFIPERAYPADFDGDQTLDLLIAKEIDVFDDARVAVLLGDGDGTFTAAPALTHDVTNLTAAGVSDLNNDQIPDIVLLQFQLPPGQVLLGNGDGTFGAPIELDQFFLSNAVDVRFGDADGDANTDLYLRGGPTAFRGGIHLGDGDGTFGASIDFVAIGLPAIYTGMTVGDFNNDGFDDVAYGSTAFPQEDAFREITVILSNGPGAFDPFVSLPVGESGQHLGTVDANGDGIDDIAAANVFSNDVSLLVSNGDGTFRPQRRFGVDSNPRALQVADVTGDGLADLIVPDGQTSGIGVLPHR